MTWKEFKDAIDTTKAWVAGPKEPEESRWIEFSPEFQEQLGFITPGPWMVTPVTVPWPPSEQRHGEVIELTVRTLMDQQNIVTLRFFEDERDNDTYSHLSDPLPAMPAEEAILLCSATTYKRPLGSTRLPSVYGMRDLYNALKSKTYMELRFLGSVYMRLATKREGPEDMQEAYRVAKMIRETCPGPQWEVEVDCDSGQMHVEVSYVG